MTKLQSTCVITWVQMFYWLMVKWIQAIIMQCSPHAALWNMETWGNPTCAGSRAPLYHTYNFFLFLNCLYPSAFWWHMYTTITILIYLYRNTNQMHQCASKQTAVSVWQMPVAVCWVLNSWWWTERQPETCRVSLQNNINFRHSCIWLVFIIR